MRSPRRAPLATAVALATLAVTASAADGRTIRFADGRGSTLSDRGIHCNVGVSDAGRGTVECSGRVVWERWERRATCADGYIGLRAIRLRETGRSGKGLNCGVGGVESSDRGDAIVAGDLRGRHLSGGGFTFRNRAGHGFTITARSLRTF